MTELESSVAAGLANGFLLGLTLIVAIGAQNAFVLRQGLLQRHVLAVVLVCALSDAALIAAGVGGLGALVQRNATLLTVVTAGGALFLFLYGLFAFRRASAGGSMPVEGEDGGTLRSAVLTVLALTFLNPHVYLDTVLLLGSLSARYVDEARTAYAAGAMTASVVWFVSLGYGARLLAPLFARPTAWRMLDVGIGIVMWLIALKLVSDLRAGF